MYQRVRSFFSTLDSLSLVVGLVVCLVACGASRQTHPTLPETELGAPPWTRGSRPDDLPEDKFYLGVGDDHQKALSALEANIFGKPKDRPFVELPKQYQPLFDDKLTKLFKHKNGQQWVLLAASKSSIKEHLVSWYKKLGQELEKKTLIDPKAPVDPSRQLALYISTYIETKTRSFICRRLADLGKPDCKPSETTSVTQSIHSFFRNVRLDSLIPSGIPYVPHKKPYRALEIRCIYKDTSGEKPLGSVPITFEAPMGLLAQSEDIKTRTDDGTVSLDFAAAPKTGQVIYATIDRATLFGSSAKDFTNLSMPRVKVSLRPLRWDRLVVAAQIKEISFGQRTKWAFKAMQRFLQLKGLKAFKPSSNITKQLEQLSNTDKPNILEGGADILLVGEVTSQFASRMGARSVWYEATGILMVFNAWTGKQIGRVQNSVQAVAIGERTAARKAMQQFGKKSAQTLITLLQGHLQ